MKDYQFFFALNIASLCSTHLPCTHIFAPLLVLMMILFEVFTWWVTLLLMMLFAKLLTQNRELTFVFCSTTRKNITNIWVGEWGAGKEAIKGDGQPAGAVGNCLAIAKETSCQDNARSKGAPESIQSLMLLTSQCPRANPRCNCFSPSFFIFPFEGTYYNGLQLTAFLLILLIIKDSI